jgi:hypothetical protein
MRGNGLHSPPLLLFNALLITCASGPGAFILHPLHVGSQCRVLDFIVCSHLHSSGTRGPLSIFQGTLAVSWVPTPCPARGPAQGRWVRPLGDGEMDHRQFLHVTNDQWAWAACEGGEQRFP